MTILTPFAWAIAFEFEIFSFSCFFENGTQTYVATVAYVNYCSMFKESEIPKNDSESKFYALGLGYIVIILLSSAFL